MAAVTTLQLQSSQASIRVYISNNSSSSSSSNNNNNNNNNM